MISPLRILMLYKQEGLVQTQALYSMEAPWLPKSDSGTRSPSLHLRHRGKAFSTKSPPSFSLEDCIRLLYLLLAKPGEEVSRGGASAAASASPQHVIVHAIAIIPQIASYVSILMKIFSSFLCCTLPLLIFQSCDRPDRRKNRCSSASCFHISATSIPSIAGAAKSVKHSDTLPGCVKIPTHGNLFILCYDTTSICPPLSH